MIFGNFGNFGKFREGKWEVCERGVGFQHFGRLEDLGLLVT